MLVSMKQVMSWAEERKCAVGAFNAIDFASLRAIIDAAEELGSPVILMHAQCHETLAPIDYTGPAMLAAARKAKVPVCVHLDHGEDEDYCRRALELGFMSVMFDGSVLPYEENVRRTKHVAAMAHACGAEIEGELGAMGARNGGEGAIYTDPVQAEAYVAETGVDLLACSFGTAHGLYLKTPKLSFDVLKGIRSRIGTPLVMHGGSGVSEADYVEAIACGIRKINYFTYMSKAGGEALKAYVESRGEKPALTFEANEQIYEPMKENVKQAIRVFGRY